jgi:hypothetical protein
MRPPRRSSSRARGTRKRTPGSSTAETARDPRGPSDQGRERPHGPEKRGSMDRPHRHREAVNRQHLLGPVP